MIFALRLLIVKVWTFLCSVLETSYYDNLLKSMWTISLKDTMACSFGSSQAVLSPVFSLTDVRAGMSGSLPGGSVISRLLINADPFNSEPENL